MQVKFGLNEKIKNRNFSYNHGLS